MNPTTYTCPGADEVDNGHTVIGCGAVFDAVPDDEGLVDCPRCGIWFDPDQEGPAERRPPESSHHTIT